MYLKLFCGPAVIYQTPHQLKILRWIICVFWSALAVVAGGPLNQTPKWRWQHPGRPWSGPSPPIWKLAWAAVCAQHRSPEPCCCFPNAELYLTQKKISINPHRRPFPYLRLAMKNTPKAPPMADRTGTPICSCDRSQQDSLKMVRLRVVSRKLSFRI